MNNREWIKQIIEHKDTGKTPYNFMFSPPARRLVESHYKIKSIERELDFPVRMTSPRSIKPLYAPPEKYGEQIQDEFGVIWSTSAIDRGSPIKPCLAEPDLSGYRFPFPDQPCRFDEIGEWCKRQGDSFRIIWIGDLWERATFRRGMENLLMDIKLNPEFVKELLCGISNFILGTMKILFQQVLRFDGVALSDDYGNQKQLVMNPADWRQFVKPLLKEIYGLARANNRVVFHHSCGNIVEIIPDLIEIGLDILHPIQPEAMDIFALKKEFGKDLAFCGGLRTQDLLPRGTPEEIKKEVRMLKDKMGKGGGYILEPGITIQADVPEENIAAMIDEARK